MYLLDTTALIDILRERMRVQYRFAELPPGTAA
jgi:predicted nucleic acid-binding protein